MKEHISATIDRDVLAAARRRAREERRTLSSLIEVALAAMTQAPSEAGGVVLASSARYRGAYRREDSYGDR